MTSLVSASQVVTGQVQSLDSVRSHALPSDAMIFASGTKVQPANQNPGSYNLVESANALTLTTTGSVPVVTQSPFADLYKEGSIYFNGTTGNYVSATATGLAGTQWNTTGMTFECWVNYPTFTGASQSAGTTPTAQQIPGLFGIIQAPTGGGINWSFGANTTGYVTLFYGGSGNQTVMAQTPISANTWNHIAVSVAPAGFIYIFINGVQSQVVANRNGTLQSAAYYETVQGTPATTNYPIVIGQYASTAVNAYVADLRITTGAGLYTGSTSSYATFTVPSAPLSPASSGVAQALIRAGQNSPYMSNGALTFDRGLRQFANFGPMTFNMYTRGFACVFRFQFNGAVPSYGYDRIFNAATSSSQTNAIQIFRDNTNAGIAFNFFLNGSQAFYLASPSTVAQNQSYVATVMYNPNVSSGTASIWINGVQVASSTGLNSSIGSTDPTIMLYNTIGAGPGLGQGAPLNASINVLAVYNRTLSNVEILNAYSALTTNTVNAPIEIGDVNGVTAFAVTSDGRVNVTKLGQTSNVLPWPPAAMTGYVTSINGGTYVASASTEFSPAGSGYPYAWYAFDRNTSNYWVTVGSGYNTSSPYNYTGTVTTTDVNGTVYPGEWLQIQLPNPIILSSYTAVFNSWTTAAPSTWVVLGSRDGVNWFLVDSRAGQTYSSATQSFTLSTAPTQAFSYFRLVTRNVTGTGGYVQVYELYYYGTADTAQTLTVAQPMTLSYGAQTASLTGISGDKYVPQDFSSSGLNIPAYVVSNTATVANTLTFSSFGPFAGEGSVYFQYPPTTTLNQCGAYISLGPSAAPNFTPVGTPFTIEGWVYFQGSSSDNNYYIFLNRGSPNTGAGTAYDMTSFALNGSFYLSMGSGVSPNSAGVSGFIYNAWNHVSGCWNGTNTIYASVNGTVVSQAVTGTPTFNAAYSFLVGAQGGAYNPRGYIACARVVRGAALYTTSFTPPTAPLQPIQGVTQAGLPYGTVLLLRNAPAPGRVLTSKFAGANSGGVLAFPPSAMTTYAVSLNSGYGQGTYVVTESSNNGYPSWQLYDKSTSTFWQVASSYTANVPYSGTIRTVDISGNSYAGEWSQIQLPVSIILSNYSIYEGGGAMPTAWYILGSRDGTSWYLIDQRNTSVWTGYTTFNVAASQAYTYYRFVYNTSNGTSASLYEIIYNGTIEGPNVTADGRLGVGVSAPTQALEVSGSAVVNGTLSAGNPLTFRNAFINGGMAINQRGISTNWTFATTVGATHIYGLDRWNIFRGSLQTGACVAQGTLATTDAPYAQGIQYYQRVGRVNGDTGTQSVVCAGQLESRDSYRFTGAPATFSFWYRTGSGFTGTLQINYFYGTGTDQAWRSGVTGSTTLSQATLPASNAWQFFAVTAFVPLTATQLFAGLFSNPSGTAGGFDYFDVTGVQLEKGTVATPFEVRPYATELALCQRYFEKSHNQAVTPANGYTDDGARYIGSAYVTTNVQVNIFFEVPKRPGISSSGITFSNSSAVVGASQWGLYTSSAVFAAKTVNVDGITERNLTVGMSHTGLYANSYLIAGGWTASSEI